MLTDDELGPGLRSVTGADPTPEFDRKLRADLERRLADRKAAEQDAGDSVERGEPDTDFEIEVAPAAATQDGGQSTPLRWVAAVVLVLGMAGAFVVTSLRGGATVSADVADVAEDLFDQAQGSQLSDSERLGLLAESVHLDATEQSLVEFAEQMKTAGLLQLANHSTSDVRSAAISPDGQFVLFAAAQESMLWDVATGEVRPAEGTAPFHEVFTYENLIHVGISEAEPVVDPRTGEAVVGAFPGVGLPGGRFAVGPTRFQRVSLVDLDAGSTIAQGWVPFEPIGARGAADGSVVFFGQPERARTDLELVAWTPGDGTFSSDHPVIQAGATSLNHLSFSVDGRLVAVADESTIRILTTSGYEELRTIEVGARIEDVSFTDTSESLVVLTDGADGGRVEVRAADTATVIVEFEADIPFGVDVTQRYAGPHAGRSVLLSRDGAGVEVVLVDPATWVDAACASDTVVFPAGAQACR